MYWDRHLPHDQNTAIQFGLQPDHRWPAEA
jgi:hypothetical protein